MGKHKRGVLILHGFTASLDCVRGVEPPLKEMGLPTRMPILSCVDTALHPRTP